MKIGILGSGVVAQALGSGLLGHGHEIMLGTRHPEHAAVWAAQHAAARVGSFADAAAYGDVVVLAVKGTAAVDVLDAAGADNLAGKPVIDVTNPIADEPPTDGVLSFFTDLHSSLMERLQAAQPAAHLVKAFNSVGSQHMIDPKFDGGRPTMFICGNHDEAKGIVAGLLDEVGWEAVDLGGVTSARAIEPLCILWCIPGLLRNEWDHAFKLLG